MTVINSPHNDCQSDASVENNVAVWQGRDNTKYWAYSKLNSTANGKWYEEEEGKANELREKDSQREQRSEWYREKSPKEKCSLKPFSLKNLIDHQDLLDLNKIQSYPKRSLSSFASI